MPGPSAGQSPRHAVADPMGVTGLPGRSCPLRVSHLTVRLPGGQPVLQDISFAADRKQLIAIIGLTGSGKTTLAETIAGIRRPAGGEISWKGARLHQGRGASRVLGFVPQDPTLHRQLTARYVLDRAGDLWLPRGTSRRDRRQRTDEVLVMLGVTGRARSRVSKLSGGERGRVSTGLALIAEPSLLLLDEPTANLDPGRSRLMMRLLADLAHDGAGRTVLVTTHSESCLDLCDRVVVLSPDGKLAYFGTPAEGLAWFGAYDWADVFEAFISQPGRDWAAQFAASADCEEYVTAPLASAWRSTAVLPPVPPPPPRGRLSQLITLCRRDLALIASDPVYLAVLAGIPALFALFVHLTPSPEGLTGPRGTNSALQPLLLFLFSAVVIASGAGSVRAVVTERAIFGRERLAGLSPAAYLASKLAVLGTISAAQAAAVTVAGLAGRVMPAQGLVFASPLLELALVMAAVAVASCALALVLSCVSRSANVCQWLMICAVVLQGFFTGGVLSVRYPVLEQLSWLSPSRWGFAAAASTTRFTQVTQPIPGVSDSPLWAVSARAWEHDMAALAVLTAAWTLLAWLLLSARRGASR